MSREHNNEEQSFRSEEASALRFWTFYLGLNVTVGCGIAVVLESRGYPWTAAIPLGAMSSVLAVSVFTCVCQAIRCAVWRSTRGYPFAKGDVVEVTSGPLRGMRGRIALIGQGSSLFYVAIEGRDDTMSFSAAQLRKVVHETSGDSTPISRA